VVVEGVCVDRGCVCAFLCPCGVFVLSVGGGGGGPCLGRTGPTPRSRLKHTVLVWPGSGIILADASAHGRARPARNKRPGGRSMAATADTLHNKTDSFTVRPLSPALGAEISGVDLRDPIDDMLKQKLLDAWHQHLVILLRNQTLDEDTQVRFAETFGPPAKTTSGRSYSAKHPSVMLISNIREDGKPIGALPDGE